MKTILLWDPRFPDRRPSRLTVEDTVASAAVRAGVAAAANPAEAGALSAGGALDPTMLTEVVLQHGNGGATRRVFLPYSVVMVGALAGVLAAIGTPIPGGVTPTPSPALGTLTINGNLTQGAPASGVTITGATTGSVITLNIAGLTISGNGATRTVSGTPSAAGILMATETLAGANGSPRNTAIGNVLAGSGTVFRQPAAGDPYILGVLGASRQKQAAGTTDTGSYKRTNAGTNGWVNYARAWLPGVEVELIADEALIYNGLLYYGTMFANDGNSISVMRSRLQAMADSDIHAAVVDFSIGSEFVSGTAANYLEKLKFAINFLRANGIKVIWFEQYERGVNDGSGWEAGGQARAKVLQVVADMRAWCPAQNPPVPIFETRATLIDQTTSVNQPYRFAYRSDTDETHPQPVGGQRVMKANLAMMRAQFPDVPINPARAANVVTNQEMAGSVAMVSLNGVSGNLPTGYTAAATVAGQSSSVGLDVVTINGTRMIEATVNRSAMPNDSTARSEAFKVIAAHGAMATGKWWKARAKHAFLGGSGMRAQFTTLRDNLGSENFTRAMPTINGSGTFLSDATSLFQDTAAYGVAEDFRARTHAIQFPNTGNVTLEMSATWDRGDGSPLIFRFAAPEIWEVPDPHLVNYNEAIPGPAVITSSANATTPEGRTLAIQLTANMGGTWAISGADAAAFNAPDSFGNLTMAERYFDAPADANADNVYSATVTFTPRNPTIAAATQALNVSVTKVAGLFVDNFNRADGPLLPDARYTTLGTGTQVPAISGNRLGVSAGSGRLAVIPVGQSAGNFKRMSIVNRVSAIAGVIECPVLSDADNFIGFRGGASNINVDARVAGALTSTSLTRYATYSGGETLMAQVDAAGANIDVYQNGVLRGSVPIPAALQGVRQAGVIFGNSGAASPVLDDLIVQDRADIVSKTAFNPITYADGTTSKTDQPLSGSQSIAGYTLGSAIGRGVVSNLGSGSITADGDIIRWDGLTAATSYSIPIIESDPGDLGAVNSPRTSTLTLVVA